MVGWGGGGGGGEFPDTLQLNLLRYGSGDCLNHFLRDRRPLRFSVLGRVQNTYVTMFPLPALHLVY